MHSSYTDSKGVWRLGREEDEWQGRSFYREEGAEDGSASRIQGTIRDCRHDFK